jgi:hypothetical protein
LIFKVSPSITRTTSIGILLFTGGKEPILSANLSSL